MKSKFITVLAGLVLASISGLAAPFGSAFTYQGRLNASGAPSADGLYDFRFTLQDAATLGSSVGTAVTLTAVPVTNGLFTVPLEFGATAFTGGEARWLQLQVNSNGLTPLVMLNPRQRVSPMPQAIYAGSATTAATATTATTASGVAAGAVTSSSLAPGAVGGPAIADGSITSVDLNSSLLNNTFWKLVGNDVVPGQFLGSTNNQPVEIRANNFRALRLEPRGSGSPPNVLGGYHNNTAGNFSGVAIAGGGTQGSINQVAGDYAFIGAGHGGYPGHFAAVVGGAYNNSLGQFSFVGTGQGNTNFGLYAAIVGGSSNAIAALGDHGFIGGGQNNIANNTHATVGGGEANRATSWATVGGGRGNQVDGAYATIAGGRSNSSGGTYATVPGGYLNLAAGQFSFAAGNRAKANHQGSFVWADSQNIDFTSSASDQFLIRAAGNVGINKPNPATALDVNGTVTATSFTGNGAGLTGLNGANLTGTVPAAALGNAWRIGGNTGTAGAVLGTVDSQPMILAAGNSRVLSLETKVVSVRGVSSTAVNVLGGANVNTIANGVIGATIGGGGSSDADAFLNTPHPNTVVDAFGTVGGGLDNTAGRAATVAGGEGNQASGNRSFVGGGFNNLAAGGSSFAAGNRAKANHNGSFVWADSQNADFASTAENQFNIRAAGGLRVSGNGGGDLLAVSSGGNLGIGTAQPSARLSVVAPGAPELTGSARSATLLTSAGGLGTIAGNELGLATIGFGTDPGGNGNNSSLGIRALRVADGSTWPTTAIGLGMDVDNTVRAGASLWLHANGNVGIGTSVPAAKLDVADGDIRLSSGRTISSSGVLHIQANADLFLNPFGGAGTVFVGGGGGPGNFHVTGNIRAGGTTTTSVLTITGGADIAEPFKMSGQDLPKGAVVVIDEANPGHLRLSDSAYDTRVAGIISGANGVNPGISLSQQGVMEGDQNVALSGRVYVQADASTGAIKPGDLLTTSATPGHAMKVAEHGKAQGAILGKAMTALAEGKGMVLVLVTLQ